MHGNERTRRRSTVRVARPDPGASTLPAPSPGGEAGPHLPAVHLTPTHRDSHPISRPPPPSPCPSAAVPPLPVALKLAPNRQFPAASGAHFPGDLRSTPVMGDRTVRTSSLQPRRPLRTPTPDPPSSRPPPTIPVAPRRTNRPEPHELSRAAPAALVPRWRCDQRGISEARHASPYGPSTVRQVLSDTPSLSGGM